MTFSILNSQSVKTFGSTVQKRTYFIFIIIIVIEKLLALQLLTTHVQVNIKHIHSTNKLILIKSIHSVKKIICENKQLCVLQFKLIFTYFGQ